MKSIMHEASSLAKAIEQGWEKAGKPNDFSIKILEKPQKNFFGFTTHSAKIALYFDERPQQRHEAHPARHKPREHRETHQRSEHRQEQRVEQRPLVQRQPEVRETRPPEPRVRQQQRPEPRVPEQRVAEPTQAQKHEVQWSEEMISYVREWLGVVLPESVGKRIGFTIEPNNLYLRITFESPMLDNQEKEKRLYASLSLLVLEALKRKFRVGLRRHKVILTNG